MDADGINQVLREVFGNVGGKIINGWVSIRCPLARWQAEHKHGQDKRESAGVSINPTGVSVFNCFTCGNKMPIQGMLRKYSNYTGEDLNDLIGELEEQAYLGPRVLPEWESLKFGATEIQRPLDKAVYLDLYDPAAGHPYLLSRGISRTTAKKLQLMYEPADPSDGHSRILFPVFGADGELYGLSGRDTTGEALLKVRDYFGLKKAANLLGAHLVNNPAVKRILLVEGLFDYARGWQCGQPTVAAMHSTLTVQQAQILRELGKPVYLFSDDDPAGEKMALAAGGLLCDYVPVMRVRYPEIWIEDPEEDDGGHYVADPGELEPQDFEDMIKDARLF
jgi:hypothetical protein